MSCPAHRGRRVWPASICGPSVWKENAGDSSGLIQRCAGPVQSDGAAVTEGEDAMNVLRGKVVLKETSVGIPGL